MPTPTPIDATHYFEVDPTIAVQVSNDAGACWVTEFDTWFRNTGVKFKTRRKIQVK
jgi:hypothetical protein